MRFDERDMKKVRGEQEYLNIGEWIITQPRWHHQTDISKRRARVSQYWRVDNYPAAMTSSDWHNGKCFVSSSTLFPYWLNQQHTSALLSENLNIRGALIRISIAYFAFAFTQHLVTAVKPRPSLQHSGCYLTQLQSQRIATMHDTTPMRHRDIGGHLPVCWRKHPCLIMQHVRSSDRRQGSPVCCWDISTMNLTSGRGNVPQNSEVADVHTTSTVTRIGADRSLSFWFCIIFHWNVFSDLSNIISDHFLFLLSTI